MFTYTHITFCHESVHELTNIVFTYIGALSLSITLKKQKLVHIIGKEDTTHACGYAFIPKSLV